MALTSEETKFLYSLKSKGVGKDEAKRQFEQKFRSQPAATSQAAPTEVGSGIFKSAASKFGDNVVKAAEEPPRERTWGEFAGDTANAVGSAIYHTPGAIYNAPGQLYGSVVDAAKESKKTPGNNFQKAFDLTTNVLDRGANEVVQFGAGAVSEIPRSAVNVASFINQMNPMMGISDAVVADRDSKTGQTSRKPSEYIQDMFSTAQSGIDSIEDISTSFTGVPKESFSGGAGRFATNLLLANKAEKAVTAGAKTLLPNLFSKTTPAIGSTLRAKSIMRAGDVAEGGLQAAAKLEKVANNIQPILKNWVKRAGMGITSANASTILSEGRTADLTETALATGAYALTDMFGNFLQDRAIKDYRKSLNIMKGVGVEDDVGKFVDEKIPLAIKEGYTGGRDPQEYANLAQQRIKAYSEVVDESFAQNSNNAMTAEDFFKDANEDLDKLFASGQPERAEALRQIIDEVSGKGVVDRLKETNRVMRILEAKLKEAAKAMREAIAKKANINTLNKNRNTVTSYIEQLRTLAQQRAKDLQILEVKNKPLLPSDLRKFKQIAAQVNDPIINGKQVADATTGYKNEAWMLIRDSAEKTLNRLMPNLKVMNSKLNLAYRVNDAVEPLIRNVEQIVDKGKEILTNAKGATLLKQGTKRTAYSQAAATALKSPLLQKAAAVTSVKGKKEIENYTNNMKNLGQNIGNWFTNKK